MRNENVAFPRVLIAKYVTLINSVFVPWVKLRKDQGPFRKCAIAAAAWAAHAPMGRVTLGHSRPSPRWAACAPPRPSAARPLGPDWCCTCWATPAALGPLNRMGGRWPFSLIKRLLI